MAYFSNGSEGMDYCARYCDRCIHQNGQDGESGCPVWLLHLLYAYDECNGTGNAKAMLDALIPMEDTNFKEGPQFKVAGKCRMFHEGVAPEPKPESNIPVTVIPSMEEWARKHKII